VAANNGFLVAVSAADLTLSSPDCPWVISAQQGQRINLTLFSFSFKPTTVAAALTSSISLGGGSELRESSADALRACRTRVMIIDGNRTTEATLCIDSQRQKRLYSSRGSRLRVYVEPEEGGAKVGGGGGVGVGGGGKGGSNKDVSTTSTGNEFLMKYDGKNSLCHCRRFD